MDGCQMQGEKERGEGNKGEPENERRGKDGHNCRGGSRDEEGRGKSVGRTKADLRPPRLLFHSPSSWSHAKQRAEAAAASVRPSSSSVRRRPHRCRPRERKGKGKMQRSVSGVRDSKGAGVFIFPLDAGDLLLHCLCDIVEMEVLRGQKLLRCVGGGVSSDGGRVELADEALSDKRVVLFYFSARWCPPCRVFTPVLHEFYTVCNRLYLFALYILLSTSF